ncbi:hypothetical protein GIB67_018712 [Kingdonia uniflora]|uniref:Helicase ATP-binding domain-containing protein n=1 Tax=Kingdonia uniflora TaxID=39325 RepID=A0A7J7L298_9MAGN|nr:hypothetical protein GIB67_018712 [Kingdonia uniflora]
MKKSPFLPVKDAGGIKKQLCERESLLEILKNSFGHSEFRGKQLEAIEAILSGRDCFCLMPTGGGKSMCYQIPALTKSGIVLVVCPLIVLTIFIASSIIQIALMENQVMALKEKGIAAEYLSSSQSPKIREKIHEDLASGKPTLRPSYRNLSSLRNRLPDVPILALTATAVPKPSYRNLSSLRNRLPDVPILALTVTAVPNNFGIITIKDSRFQKFIDFGLQILPDFVQIEAGTKQVNPYDDDENDWICRDANRKIYHDGERDVRRFVEPALVKTVAAETQVDNGCREDREKTLAGGGAGRPTTRLGRPPDSDPEGSTTQPLTIKAKIVVAKT